MSKLLQAVSAIRAVRSGIATAGKIAEQVEQAADESAGLAEVGIALAGGALEQVTGRLDEAQNAVNPALGIFWESTCKPARW